MAGLSVVELATDCLECGLEAGSTEVYDSLVPACRFGLPATTSCKLCSAACRGAFDGPSARPMKDVPANRCPACLAELTPAAIDERGCGACGAHATLEPTTIPARFATVAALEGALDAWALRESFPSREALVAATFAEPDVTSIFARLERRQPIEVVADPFANMGIRTTGRARSTEPKREPRQAPQAVVTEPARETTAPLARPIARSLEEPVPEPAPPPARIAGPNLPLAPPPSAPPRAIVYPLVSVIAADGEIHPEERALVDRFLQSEGLPPLAEDEFCVHHPSAVAHFVPKERREDVVKLMCESAAVDGMPDESERRVIRAYATAWGVDDEKVEFWMWGYETMNTSLTRQLFLKLRRFVLSARWSDPLEGRP